MSSTFLGIDLGTSSLKLILTDGDKNVLKCVSCEYELSHPAPGWSEIDPEIWKKSLMSAMEQCFEREDASSLRAIGVTGQMHTLVLLDDEGRMVRPAIMWNDKRTAGLIPALRERIRAFPEGKPLAGIISTGSPAAGLYWMSLEEKETLAKVRHFLIGPDYVVYALTGSFGTDYCEASTSSLYQAKERCWSENMRKLIGIDPCIYPEVYGSSCAAGTILPELAHRFNIPEDTVVIRGTGDNPAAAVSIGCLGQGYPALSLGTSGVLMVPVKDPDQVRKGKTILFSPDGKEFSYLVQGAVQSTGESISWISRKILGTGDLSGLTEKVDAEKMRRLPLMYYPHLGGEKTIYADPNLRGAFFGLQADTTPEQLFYAVMEGISFGFRELKESMGVDFSGCEFLRVVGGGSGSDIWMQLLCDILQVPTARMEGNIGAGFGAVLMAMSAGAEGSDFGQLTDGTLKIGKIFYPDPEAVQILEEKYQKYLRIHDAVKYIDEGEEEIQEARTGTAG